MVAATSAPECDDADGRVRRRGWRLTVDVAERSLSDEQAKLAKAQKARADFASKLDAARERLAEGRDALSAGAEALATDATPKAVQKHASAAAEVVAVESMIPVLERRLAEAERQITAATAAVHEAGLVHEGALHAADAAPLAPFEIERRRCEADAVRLRAEADRLQARAQDVWKEAVAASRGKAWEADVAAITDVVADALAAESTRQAAE